jgi:hypothetical protein
MGLQVISPLRFTRHLPAEQLAHVRAHPMIAPRQKDAHLVDSEDQRIWKGTLRSGQILKDASG